MAWLLLKIIVVLGWQIFATRSKVLINDTDWLALQTLPPMRKKLR